MIRQCTMTRARIIARGAISPLCEVLNGAVEAAISSSGADRLILSASAGSEYRSHAATGESGASCGLMSRLWMQALTDPARGTWGEAMDLANRDQRELGELGGATWIGCEMRRRNLVEDLGALPAALGIPPRERDGGKAVPLPDEKRLVGELDAAASTSSVPSMSWEDFAEIDNELIGMIGSTLEDYDGLTREQRGLVCALHGELCEAIASKLGLSTGHEWIWPLSELAVACAASRTPEAGVAAIAAIADRRAAAALAEAEAKARADSGA